MSACGNPTSVLDVGPAVTVSLLLSDWGRYTLSDRVWYHFCLTDALIGSREQSQQLSKDKEYFNDQKQMNDQNESTESFLTSKRRSNTTFTRNEQVCGVSSLLECIPMKQWHKLTRKQKRDLKATIRNFNAEASIVRLGKNVFCHEPERLPLPVNPHTRVFFAYEVNRIAFCLDASPSLTSTFGFSGSIGGNGFNDRACCPMDRLAGMTRCFFDSLIEPILTPSATNDIWQPVLAVTVLAVYPKATGGTPTSILVRDFQVTDRASAAFISKKIEEWALGVVETEIARRFSHRNLNDYQDSPCTFLRSYDAGVIPMYSSSLRDLLDAGDAALMSLSSEARPSIVVATDGRSVACDGIIDIVTETDRVDTQLIVLDLSDATSHNMISTSQRNMHGNERALIEVPKHHNLHSMNYDPGGAMFPLHLSDDSEALYNVCMATGGCYFDFKLLQEASKTKAGDVKADSHMANDHFFTFKRHSISPNAVQWYILFSSSQLTETLYSATMGKLAPHEYIRARVAMNDNPDIVKKSSLSVTGGSGTDTSIRSDYPKDGIPRVLEPSKVFMPRKSHARTIFSTYIINPIPIHGILLMRIKEGYRAKLYGKTTNDPNRVSIQMILPLDLGTVLHYELSYTALPDELWIGFAHIKIELSGDSGFIALVKNDFLHQVTRDPLDSMTYQFSSRLCKLMRSIRREDMLQSHLSPLKWTDQLSSPNTPFVGRIRTLTAVQRKLHFRYDEFDCVCIGRMPWASDEEFLQEFQNLDNGEEALVDVIDHWAAQSIVPGKKYVNPTRSVGGLAGYCVVELKRSPFSSRLFTVVVETLCSHGSGDRHSLLNFLRSMITQIKEINVLPKQLGQFLVRPRTNSLSSTHSIGRKEKIFQSQLSHASWDLVKDPEILPLLMRRRSEIGNFLLLESTDTGANFAKLVSTDSISSRKISDPGDFVQYQLAVLADKVVVDVHMESEGGIFYPFHYLKNIESRDTIKKSNFVKKSKFQQMTMILKKRDQECGHALRCRTALLRAFNESQAIENEEETHISCVQKLLAYASKLSIRLRSFQSDMGSANTILLSLTAETLLSQAFEAKVAKLRIDPEASIDDLDSGDWYVIEYDKHTISMVHLSFSQHVEFSEVDGKRNTYRELTFFTFGVTDLYNERDDVTDEGSDAGHISEHLPVSKFCNAILAAHKQNYSAAAYVSLKSDPSAITYFDSSDFAEVMRPLKFVEVARVIVGGEWGVEQESDSKLVKMITSVLHPVTDEIFYPFHDNMDKNNLLTDYSEGGSEASTYELSNAEISTQVSDDEIATPHIQAIDEDYHDEDDSLSLHSGDSEKLEQRLVPSPIFVRFFRDDKPISFREIALIKESSTLTALVSVFEKSTGSSTGKINIDRTELPLTHFNVSIDIAALLNAYVADQTLERLRQYGLSIWNQEQNLQLVKSCLRKSNNVVTSTMEVYFYISKADKVVAASAPAWSIPEVEEGFNLLYSELLNSNTMSLKPYGVGDGFLVDVFDENSTTLSYWCFVNIRRTRGVVTVKIHHSTGLIRGSELMNDVLDMISFSCHRVNQLLLLRRLHQSRSASSLQIPPDPDFVEEDGFKSRTEETGPFYDGVFSCPVVFQTSFELFHRCATNPAQVARSLAATVLHIFSVSNRKQLFVYKDESGSIFYMDLLTTGGGIEADGFIELLVYGLNNPGPSVTIQLRSLLQKRLLLIAVDMLSSVLTMNPHYSWRQGDINFIREFEEKWKDLESEKSFVCSPSECVYTFPLPAYDPGMILLFFRQNLCGSTFFHRLVSSEWIEEDTSEKVPSKVSTLHLSPTDLLFYYNNSPSKLDPKFQSQSTLTDKGAQFSMQAGSGIAIIELSLLDINGRSIRDLDTANKPFAIERFLCMPHENVVFKEKSNKPDPYVTSQVFLKVKITDTALKREVIHKWIHLTLNQVLLAWNVERILERSQRDLFLPLPSALSKRNASLETAKKLIFEKISCGLPALTSCLDMGEKLPHPAMRKAEHFGMVRASSVATLTLELLDRVIFDNLLSETKAKLLFDSQNFVLIRSSRRSKPRRVELRWDATRQRALVQGDNPINDSPIDCPEYTIFYCFPEFKEKRSSSDVSPPKLFEEVTVGGDRYVELSDSKSLQALKDRNYYAFRRSFAFILSVKRNRRVLHTYNWSASIFKSISWRLIEHCASCVASTEQTINRVQIHVLKNLAPTLDSVKDIKPKVIEQDQNNVPNANVPSRALEDQSNTSNSQQRRVTRPLSIRKPKLVGKSVEGAAVHAAAASRARASVNRFKGNNHAPISPAVQKAVNDEGMLNRHGSSGRLSANSRPASIPEKRDDSASENRQADKAASDFCSIIRRDTLLRQCTAMCAARLFLTRNLWPLKNSVKDQHSQQISPSSTIFLVSRSHLSWNDVSEVLPLPSRLLRSFLPSFGQELTRMLQLKFVPLNSSIPSLFLFGRSRNLRSCKCFTVIGVSTTVAVVGGQRKTIVSLEGRTLYVRRNMSKNRSVRIVTNRLLEKDSAGLDKLSFDLRHAIRNFDGLLFDHACTVMERSMKSIKGELEYYEVARLLQKLVLRYPLRKMMSLHSNYKGYEATIVLKSYKNRLLDKFDGPSLFNYLLSNLREQHMVRCGPMALCFKREIAVQTTHSMCFLMCDKQTPEKMQLAIVCRTQGKDLYEFMFREGSNVAISILDNIAVEAAGLAHAELVFAASCLERDNLILEVAANDAKSQEQIAS